MCIFICRSESTPKEFSCFNAYKIPLYKNSFSLDQYWRKSKLQEQSHYFSVYLIFCKLKLWGYKLTSFYVAFLYTENTYKQQENAILILYSCGGPICILHSEIFLSTTDMTKDERMNSMELQVCTII